MKRQAFPSPGLPSCLCLQTFVSLVLLLSCSHTTPSLPSQTNLGLPPLSPSVHKLIVHTTVVVRRTYAIVLKIQIKTLLVDEGHINLTIIARVSRAGFWSEWVTHTAYWSTEAVETWLAVRNFSQQREMDCLWRAGLHRISVSRASFLCLVLSFLVVCSSCVELSMGMGMDGAHIVMKTSCSSFFFNSQVNNAQGWKIIPAECEDFVAQYMNEGQYYLDTEGVATAAAEYLKGIAPREDGMDVVIFDIDETALSNLPYYQQHRYGGEIFDHPKFSTWVEEGTAPAIPAMLGLYTALQADRWGLVFMTGRTENQRDITSKNLVNVGYDSWTSLLLRSPAEVHLTAEDYKTKRRMELQEQGYRIWSSLGDQWSDLAGPAVGNRTFKLPNPMYYIS